MKPLRIAIVVHGRFHAFDLARSLLANGETVQLFTNYPKSVARRFGVPPDRIRSSVWHGVLTRLVDRIPGLARSKRGEAVLHRAFSRWAADQVRREEFDVIHCFSGIAEEVWQSLEDRGPLRSLVRGSAHIDTQYEILAEEERLTGAVIEKPSDWMRGRERREYDLSEQIMVLSRFAERSFIHRGVDPGKLALVPLGSEQRRFQASQEVVAERRARVLSGGKLRVLLVGTWCRRKGVSYAVEVARQLKGKCDFRFVGSVAEDARELASGAHGLIDFRPRVDQFDLPKEYAWADLFFFPTLEDGYAVVLAQARAAGLPILATPHCAAPEMVSEGIDGWICDIRAPDLYVERIRSVLDDRRKLAAMIEASGDRPFLRDWTAVADDFSSAVRTRLEGKKEMPWKSPDAAQ